MTPAEVADQITECLTDAADIAAKRYPNNANARRLDEVAQLRLLVETAAEHLHQFERERERHVEEIARLGAKTEVLEAGHAAVADNYRRRFARQASKLTKLRKKGTTNA